MDKLYINVVFDFYTGWKHYTVYRDPWGGNADPIPENIVEYIRKHRPTIADDETILEKLRAKYPDAIYFN